MQAREPTFSSEPETQVIHALHTVLVPVKLEQDWHAAERQIGASSGSGSHGTQ